MRIPDDVRRRARELIAARLGLDFPERRSPDLERALLRASSDSTGGAPHEYLARLAALPESDGEWRRLAGYLTVGETYFFRDEALFEALERRVLPSIIEARRSERVRRIRLWSAGCATGEEAYSLAILVDRLIPDLADWTVTILATDVNAAVLEVARHARYRSWSFRGTPASVRDRYFRRLDGGVFEVDHRLRRLVTLAPLNLSGASYPSPLTDTTAMDAVLCRNVLMYFTGDAQRATVERLRGALLVGGYLAVGAPEASVAGLDGLERVDAPGTLLYRQPSRLTDPTASWGSPAEANRSAWRADADGAASALGDAPENSRRFSMLRPAPAVSERPSHGERGSALAEARALADAGRLEEARRRCQTAAAHDRLDPEGHLLLAAICQESGDVSGALDAVRRALYLAPDSAPAHFLQGTLLARVGQRLRARRSMETVVKLLAMVPPGELLPGAGGLAAAHLLESARTHLELA